MYQVASLSVETAATKALASFILNGESTSCSSPVQVFHFTVAPLPIPVVRVVPLTDLILAIIVIV